MAELLQTSNLTKAYRKDAPHALKGVSIHISQGRIVGLLIGGICNVTCLYASVVLGQYWKRAKVFGVTIGVTAVVAIITYLITEHGISKKLNLQ